MAIAALGVGTLMFRTSAAEAIFWMGGKRDVPDVVRFFLSDTGLRDAVLAYGRDGAPPSIIAFGDAHADDIMPIASLSKSITAAAILNLAAAGKITLDDPLDRYVPAVDTAPDNRFRLVKIRQLLNHTAGMRPDEISFDRPGEDCSEVAMTSLKLDLAYAPGASWGYSNVGYCWLGLVIANVSGKSYEAYASDTVLSGIAGFKLTDKVRGPSHGWSATAAGFYAYLSRVNIDPAMPAVRANLGGETSYGFGWELDEKGDWWHSGSLADSFSIAIRSKDGWSAVALFRGRPSNHLARAVQLRTMIGRAMASSPSQ